MTTTRSESGVWLAGAVPTTLTQGSPEWQQYRSRALTDLFWFADVVLGYGALVPLTLKAHHLMARFAERRAGSARLDSAWVHLILVPRGVGKTTLVTQALALQTALAHPDAAILIVNETERGATKFLGEIKGQCETNAFLRALFPDRIWTDPQNEAKKWSETEVLLKRDGSRKEPTFQAIGVGGSITGMHPDLVLVDDMLSDEAMENARTGSFAIIEKTNRWIDQLRPLVNASEPWHGITFVGTPWWEGDSYQHVEKAFGYGEPKQKVTLKVSDRGKTVAVDCVRQGDLATFFRPILENGTSWFPERWPDEDLAKMRVASSLLFSANMMLNPTAPEVVIFKPEWRRYYEWTQPDTVFYKAQDLSEKYAMVSDMDCVISVDPAFTEGGSGDSRQALIVTGGTPEGLRIILKAAATRQSLDGFLRDIVQACRDYSPRKLLLEKAGQQVTFINDVRARLNAAGIAFSIVEVSPGGRNKDRRIASLEPFFERGLIYAHRDMTDLWHEYDGFPRSKYKDLLDALAYQPPFWTVKGSDGVGTGANPWQQQRVQKELAAYYQRRGLPMTGVKFGDPLRYREDGSARW